MTRRPCIAITLGDPCGIGPELLLRSLETIQRWTDVLVIGAKAGMDLLENTPPEGFPRAWTWEEAGTAVPKVPGASLQALRVHHLAPPTSEGWATWIDPTPDITAKELNLGQGSAASGRCAVEAVRIGAELVMAGKADALVTLPLSKSAAHQAGHPIPGHTEYLQELAGSPISRMAFVSPTLSVVLHTVHQSLRSVVEELSADAVAETLAFAADRFIQLTGKPDLRVALCALNPHAGENGAFGDEEQVLQKAMKQAESRFRPTFPEGAPEPYAHVPSPFKPGPAPAGWSVFPSSPCNFSGAPQATTPSPHFSGPFPSDTLFQRAMRGEFDLVIALYHDQGLIPLKVLEPLRAVNMTLGLPFIRTSPDHGTAFDKAGQWIADPTNFLEATALAVRLAGRAQGEYWPAQVEPAKGSC